jgi:hypothetical protein
VAIKEFVPMKYWIHYEEKTGVIRSISNEPALGNEASLEVSFEEYKLFIEGDKRPQDHIIGYTKDANGKTQKSVIKILDQLYGFRNNAYEWINEPPKKNTELIVEWNKQKQSWIFKLTDIAKNRLSDEITAKTIFFVMLKNDFDFLIRSIIIEVSQLLDNDRIVIPFSSKIEHQIDKISISSQLYFHSYGLIINE